jgi:uncharacterized protein (TIGR03083 family)
MDRQMSKAELLARIDAEHEQLLTLLQRLTDEQLQQPVLEGGWSVKDVLAHISWWEQRMILVLEAASRGEAPPSLLQPGEDWEIAIARLNQETFLANRERALDDVRGSFQRSFQQSVAAVAALSEEQIFDPAALGAVLSRPAFEMIADNTFEHYREHREAIHDWLAASEQRSDA